MIEINGKEYRNIQEQVKENMDDIAKLKQSSADFFTAGRGIKINDELEISTNLDAGAGILFNNQPDNALELEVDMDEVKYNLADVASSGLYGDLSNTPLFSDGLATQTVDGRTVVSLSESYFDNRVEFNIEDNITTDSSDNILSLYGYGITNVKANPTGTASTSLTKIQIGNTNYSIPYSSVEVNNPIQTGDYPLNSIEVDGDNYYIPKTAVYTVLYQYGPSGNPYRGYFTIIVPTSSTSLSINTLKTDLTNSNGACSFRGWYGYKAGDDSPRIYTLDYFVEVDGDDCIVNCMETRFPEISSDMSFPFSRMTLVSSFII